MNLLATLFAIIVISYLFVHLFKKIKVSEVVALLLLGIFFGFPSITGLLLEKHLSSVELIGTFGLFALMFLAGLESSWEKLKKEEYDAFYVALFSSLVPLFLGFCVMFFFFDFSFLVSFVVALCLSITAESAKARVLFEMGVLRSRVASALLGAGILDDLLGIILFTFLLVIIGVFNFHEHLLLMGIILSFVLGLLIQKFAREHHITKKIELFSSLCLIPFFFISMGMNFSFGSLSSSPVLLFAILVIGIGGKLLGSHFSKPYVNFSARQLHVMGWAMNSRGALDIALGVLAFKINLISSDIFSSLIVLAFTSTLIFPFVVEHSIKKYPSIME